jgi:uncharacterized protein with FMN-binding domain
MKLPIKALGVLCLAAAILGGCEDNSVSDKSDQTAQPTEVSPPVPTEKEDTNSNDGVYTGSKNISGLELSAELTISGNSWSAVSQLGDDSPEYQNGILKDQDLYDDSGLIKIGYVSGSLVSLNGYPNMRK